MEGGGGGGVVLVVVVAGGGVSVGCVWGGDGGWWLC